MYVKNAPVLTDWIAKPSITIRLIYTLKINPDVKERLITANEVRNQNLTVKVKLSLSDHPEREI